MTSFIIKFFAGMLALIVAHRIISILFALLIGFLLYKYITDPKYITNLIKSIKDIIDGFGGDALKKSESAKETAMLLFQ